MADEYPPPVDRLLTYGPAERSEPEKWPDYVQELRLGPAQVPDLIRMATDPDLEGQDAEKPEVWAPVHAWRALGQLQAAAAIEPLLPLLDGDDDWTIEEIPDVYGLIGAAAIPLLTEALSSVSQEDFPRISSIRALESIALHHPDSRDAVIQVLMHQLEAFNENNDEINGFLITALGKLKAEDAFPLIKQVFDAGRVDPMVTDWDWVQADFGLRDEEEVRREHEQRYEERLQRLQDEARLAPPISAVTGAPHPPLIVTPIRTSAKAKAKTKRKMAQESRKKNKKRK